ncbi:lipoprotein [Nocardiopsis kunsanensis]|uniref:Lipoprotein n=1 Tax=Nocardiopsis kunsanensis TaxID=141693 RepID=A0A918XJ35_9ACTN|nr:SMP-30/gluconolactonase/LRE family protein [Nocardiopsis kunsanensis]GHD33784.1 lipoprotein [Nocardiopsis kunsanensis]
MHTCTRTPVPATTMRTLVASVLVLSTAGCALSPGEGSSGPVEEMTAEQLVRATEVHEQTGMTLLEGPTFAPDGDLRFVDVAAPGEEPNVMSVDTESAELSPVFTAEEGSYTSAQFSPHDERLYLTDFAGGRIVSITPDGEDPEEFFSGEVEGARMFPDDLAFDEDGNMYISDMSGYDEPAWEEKGRVVRLDRETAEPTVLAEELPPPNGISFTEDFSGLWVGLYGANEVDHYTLNGDGTEVLTSHTAIHFDGGRSRIDSIAVDADGNLYQAIHDEPAMYVYSSLGEHLATVRVPEEDAEGLSSVTNVAIDPGTTDAYMTVSGKDGGHIYTFDALAEGTRQSNGG